MLLSLTVVAAAVALLSAVGVALSGRWSSTSWSKRTLLLVCGPVDGVLSLSLIHI